MLHVYLPREGWGGGGGKPGAGLGLAAGQQVVPLQRWCHSTPL